MINFILENQINDLDYEAIKVKKKKKYHKLGMEFSQSLLEKIIDI